MPSCVTGSGTINGTPPALQLYRQRDAKLETKSRGEKKNQMNGQAAALSAPAELLTHASQCITGSPAIPQRKITTSQGCKLFRSLKITNNAKYIFFFGIKWWNYNTLLLFFFFFSRVFEAFVFSSGFFSSFINNPCYFVLLRFFGVIGPYTSLALIFVSSL